MHRFAYYTVQLLWTCVLFPINVARRVFCSSFSSYSTEFSLLHLLRTSPGTSCLLFGRFTCVCSLLSKRVFLISGGSRWQQILRKKKLVREKSVYFRLRKKLLQANTKVEFA